MKTAEVRKRQMPGFGVSDGVDACIVSYILHK
jgi:hypothetical protein